MHAGHDGCRRSRTPAIMADAAYAIFTRRSERVTGNFFVDDEVLLSEVSADVATLASVNPQLFWDRG